MADDPEVPKLLAQIRALEGVVRALAPNDSPVVLTTPLTDDEVRALLRAKGWKVSW